jgi:hypothetical protein
MYQKSSGGEDIGGCMMDCEYEQRQTKIMLVLNSPEKSHIANDRINTFGCPQNTHD